VCTRLQEVLQDEQFVATHLGDDVPERKMLYEDPELAFCILAHAYTGVRESPPHDYGPSGAIYGQGRGETEMTDWELVEPTSEHMPGKVRRVKTYSLTPGMVYVYAAHRLVITSQSAAHGRARLSRRSGCMCS
jgi:hypothetical protein